MLHFLWLTSMLYQLNALGMHKRATLLRMLVQLSTLSGKQSAITCDMAVGTHISFR